MFKQFVGSLMMLINKIIFKFLISSTIISFLLLQQKKKANKSNFCPQPTFSIHVLSVMNWFYQKLVD
jgi:hypothetical protein